MKDTQLFESVERELNRQRNNIELIASENFVSEAVLQLAGSVLTNKYAEGYPAKRYYGGCQFVDEVEELELDIPLHNKKQDLTEFLNKIKDSKNHLESLAQNIIGR